MSFSNNNEGRATLVRSYRNLTVREIRARLEGPLGDAERVTAQAELLRRGADDDDGPDTTFVTGFAPTSASDIGAVESEPPPEVLAEASGVAAEVTQPARRAWPLVVVLVLGAAGALAWAMHAKLIRL
ncbi:hypothetical protein [Scleromatobacter humisilvae]|uniref:Uncharacterized protein n=1 Tax=Scleromatobacter humisilvae TaxID=2897159 RepID=A0A9X1YMC2_9BURK|nr:hypothetical protein [Scleromatobacter humisilvae]MCK9688778.1 hypothetical protein [Scleromatobacter humisilvae]